MTVRIKAGKGKFEYGISSEQHLLLLNVGIFMMRIQHFESLLGAIMGSLTVENPTLDNIDEILAENGKKTLGQLTGLMKTKVQGKTLHEQLEALRQHRNFVAHNCLKDYAYLDGMAAVHLALKINEWIDLTESVQNLLISELSAQDVTDISEVSMQINDDGTVIFR